LRRQYDKDNAHLTFFVLCRAAAPAFDERDLRLQWMHRAVRDFLARKGEPVDPHHRSRTDRLRRRLH